MKKKKEFIDQIGQKHYFENTPQRIVSLVPSQTELLCDLGLEEAIVGITKFCIHPYHLKATKIRVGGTKKVKFEKIIDLKPDVVIANKEENTKEIVEELSKVCPVWVTDILNVEDNFKMIRDFGEIFNKRTTAEKWIQKINFKRGDFIRFIEKCPERSVAYFIWANPYMVAGNKTFINELLKENRFFNIYESKEGRYPEIELKKMRLEGDPELVLLSSEPYPFKDEHAFEIGRFTHHAKTIFVDGEMFSWYGSRLAKAYDYFKELHKAIQ